MTQPRDEVRARARGGSTLRVLAGVTLLVVGLAGATIGFVRLTTVLDSGGYGTPPMRYALFGLGAAGASLGAGIATLIWDIAKRFEP